MCYFCLKIGKARTFLVKVATRNHRHRMSSIGSLLPKPKYTAGSTDTVAEISGIEVVSHLNAEQRELLAKVSKQL